MGVLQTVELLKRKSYRDFMIIITFSFSVLYFNLIFFYPSNQCSEYAKFICGLINVKVTYWGLAQTMLEHKYRNETLKLL